MWLSDLLLSVFIAIIFLGLLILILKPTREREGILSGAIFLFLLLLLPIWAGGVWLGPIGPTILGVYVFPFLLVGLGTALLLAAVTPPTRRQDQKEQALEIGPLYTFGPFFVAFVVLFLLVIISKYVFVTSPL